jgi:hypothetical protein
MGLFCVSLLVGGLSGNPFKFTVSPGPSGRGLRPLKIACCLLIHRESWYLDGSYNFNCCMYPPSLVTSRALSAFASSWFCRDLPSIDSTSWHEDQMYFRDRMVRGAAMVTGPNRLDPIETSRKLWTMPLEFESTCPIPIFSCSKKQLVRDLVIRQQVH